MTFNEQTRQLQASDGMCVARKDKTAAYGNSIYLGIKDSEDNYTEVTQEEAEEINKPKEENNEI